MTSYLVPTQRFCAMLDDLQFSSCNKESGTQRDLEKHSFLNGLLVFSGIRPAFSWLMLESGHYVIKLRAAN